MKSDFGCMECGQDYDVSKSDAKDPDFFCSLGCETKHDAFIEDYLYDQLRDK